MVFPMECKCLFSVVVLFSSLLALCTVPISAVEGEFVVTLDYSNFTETVAKQDFIVVEFYAPWYSLFFFPSHYLFGSWENKILIFGFEKNISIQLI